MLSRHWLYSRRCVRDLIQIADGVFLRAAARWPIVLDEPTVGLLLFWTILRGERTFLLRSLEQLGLDMWALTRDVDDLLRPGREAAPSHPTAEDLQIVLEPPLWAWLDRAERQAVALGHPYLGTEHLLLAILDAAEEPLSAVLARHHLSYDKVAGAVQAALAAAPPAMHAEISERQEAAARVGDDGIAPAVGVPRRFSLAMIMMTMVTYAILLAALRAGGANNEAIILLMVLFTAAAIGQPILFGGKNPRAAATLVGAVLFPVEVLTLLIYGNCTDGYRMTPADECVGLTIVSIPGGALLGYAAGCLAAGMFYFNDCYEKFKQRHAPPEQPEPDPLARDD